MMFLPWQIYCTCLYHNFFLYLISKSEKIGLELHSFTWDFDYKCHNIFWKWKYIIFLQKKLDNGFPYPEVRKALFLFLLKTQSNIECLANITCSISVNCKWIYMYCKVDILSTMKNINKFSWNMIIYII